MTATVASVGPDTAPLTTEELKARFAPVFARIAEGTLQREQESELAHEAVELLRESGFTRLRLSADRGGLGASLEQLMDLMVDLAVADPNLPQALHGHFMFTELMEHQHQGPVSDWWLDEVAAGKLFANALVELPPSSGARPVTFTPIPTANVGPEGDLTPGEHSTQPQPGTAYTVDGDKFYSTGTLFADYILVLGASPENPETYAVLDTRQAGVERIDDWNGIGQRLTASGTTRFTGAVAEAGREVILAVPAGPLGFPLLWLILAATQAGIARAAERDASRYVASRRRTYEHSAAERPALDPLVQSVVGAISAEATAARLVVLGAAGTLESALDATRTVGLDSPEFQEHYTRAAISASEASVVVSELTLNAANRVFEIGGASALLADRQLDRHWRNARVLASHTPTTNRHRLIGDHRVNGTAPPLSARVRNSADTSHPTTAPIPTAHTPEGAQPR